MGESLLCSPASSSLTPSCIIWSEAAQKTAASSSLPNMLPARRTAAALLALFAIAESSQPGEGAPCSRLLGAEGNHVRLSGFRLLGIDTAC